MMIRMTEAKWLLAALAMTVALGIAIPCATKAESAEKSSYDQAMEFYYAGKYEEAAKLFKEYVNDNADPKAYFRLGYSLYLQVRKGYLSFIKTLWSHVIEPLVLFFEFRGRCVGRRYEV